MTYREISLYEFACDTDNCDATSPQLGPAYTRDQLAELARANGWAIGYDNSASCPDHS